MTATTLVEAGRRFAASLEELRSKYCGLFTSWLDSALAKNPRAARQEVPQRIATIRRQFADEFIHIVAPKVIETLNPSAKRVVVQELVLYVNQVELPPSANLLPVVSNHWRPGILRTVLGAAIGTAAALLLLALQASGPAEQTASTRHPIPTLGSPTAPVVAAPLPAMPAPAPAPVQATPKPNVAPGPQAAAPASGETNRDIKQTALQIIIGAFGAALGAFAVACPPLRVLLMRFGLGRFSLGLIGKFGITFFLLRRIVFALIVSAILLFAVGFIGLIFIGPNPAWNILFALAAILAIALTRYYESLPDGDGYSAVRRAAINAVNYQLGVDGNMWAALSAGLAVQPAASGSPHLEINRLKSVIVTRRAQSDDPDRILRVVEQELDLPPGGATVEAEVSEFDWTLQSAERYDTVGIVGVGDTVTVLESPRVTINFDGTTVVLEKGKVMAKPAGN
jgi:hypothetical protein